MIGDDKMKIFMAFTDKVRAINPYLDNKDAQIQLGGSFALYLQGLTDNFGDVDIIVNSDFINFFSNLPFEQVSPRHPKRLNKTFIYHFQGLKIDFIERISKYVEGDKEFYGYRLETPLAIKEAKKKIASFLQENYPKDAVKYLE